MAIADETNLRSEAIIERTKHNYNKNYVESSAATLSVMVDAYLEKDSEWERRCAYNDHNKHVRDSCDEVSGAQWNHNCLSYNPQEEFLYILQALISYNTDKELRIIDKLSMIIERFNRDSESMCKANDLNLRRGFLKRLIVQQFRNLEQNAAICECRWDAFGWFPGGAHEYIDVYSDDINGDSRNRIIIDIEFPEHFEIARPTRQYRAMFKLLPPSFVGTADCLEQILTIMCEAAKISLKKKHLHLPPWRTLEYMQSKWFSSYTRNSTDVYFSENSDWRNFHNFRRSHATQYLHKIASRFRDTNKSTSRIGKLNPSTGIMYTGSQEKYQERHYGRKDTDDKEGIIIHVKKDDFKVDVAATDPEPPDKQSLGETADLEDILSKIRQKTLNNTSTLVYAE